MPQFDYFVVFAEMRTGSNFLEANLNALDGVACHGELFNPHFIGGPMKSEVLGVSKSERDREPMALIRAVKAETAGMPSALSGFRYFNDHDPRVRDEIIGDPRCAKIVLTRNPLDSYVSRKIAAATDQWRLTNVKHKVERPGKIVFDGAEFSRHLDKLQDFQVTLLNGLQKSGQTAFYLDYEDILDVEVMNGLASWLGLPARLDGLDKKLKKQNPEPLRDKVANFEEMERSIAAADRFNLSRTPNFEPRRGGQVGNYIAAAKTPLLYLPLRSGPDDAIRAWMTALDGAAPVENLDRKSLRAWIKGHDGHRRFTVLRHPVARVHSAFCQRILPATGPMAIPQFRANIIDQFAIPLPEGNVGADYDAKAHRAAFKGFLKFVAVNLVGQTNLRIVPDWSTQSSLLQAIATLMSPDVVIREDELQVELSRLAARVGRGDAPPLPEATDPDHARLGAVYDDEVEALARRAYQRDYEAFGFGNWH